MIFSWIDSENWSPIKSLWEISHWVLWMGYVALLLCSCLYLVLKEVRHLSPWAFGLLKMQAQLRCSVWRCRMLAMIESNLWGGRCCLQQQVVQQRPSIAGFSGASSYCHLTLRELRNNSFDALTQTRFFLILALPAESQEAYLESRYRSDVLWPWHASKIFKALCPRSRFTMQSCGCWRILIETWYYICNWTNMFEPTPLWDILSSNSSLSLCRHYRKWRGRSAAAPKEIKARPEPSRKCFEE